MLWDDFDSVRVTLTQKFQEYIWWYAYPKLGHKTS